MKLAGLAVLLLPAAAFAQQRLLPPSTNLLTQRPPSAPADPLSQPPAQQQPPVQQQWEQEGVAPTPSPNAPVPPDHAPPREQAGGQAGEQAGQPPSDQQAGQQPPSAPDNQAPATFTRPNVWVPATVARIQALDKVNAQSKDFTIKVGESASYGSLTITVKACVVRPADQPADAAAFLEVTDSHPDSGNFSGWMLQQEPSVSLMQNPIYDVRIDGCT